MYSRGIRVYGRGLNSGLTASSSPGAEEIADQLFGKPSAKPLPGIEPLSATEKPIEPLRSSLPSTSHARAPFLPTAGRTQGRKSKIKDADHLAIPSKQRKNTSPASSDDNNESEGEEWRSERTNASIKSGESYKRRRKNNKTPSQSSSLPEKKKAKPVRRKKPPALDAEQNVPEGGTKEDPFLNDPEYLKFQEEYAAVKAIKIEEKDEAAYFAESKAVQAKEFAQMVKEQSEKHEPGYSMITSKLAQSRARESGLQTTTVLQATLGKSKLTPIDESNEWTTISGQGLSTPIAVHKKPDFDVSAIDKMSPLATVRRNRPAQPKQPAHPLERKSVAFHVDDAPEGHPLVSTPINNHRPRRRENLDISGVQELSPVMATNNLSAELAEAEQEPRASADTRKSQAGPSRKTDTLYAMDPPLSPSRKPSTSKRSTPLSRHSLSNSPGRTSGAGNLAKKLRRSSQQSFVAPRSPPRLARTRRRTVMPATSLPNAEPENRLEKTEKATSLMDVTRKNLGNTRRAFQLPETPLALQSQSILPRRRESLALFSPFERHDQTIQTTEERVPYVQPATLSRKSVVFDTSEGTFIGSDEEAVQLILDISTPKQIVDMKSFLGKKGDYSDLVKIGEGSFADVYSVVINGQQIVLKIVPVAGVQPDGTQQTSFQDILGEAIISRLLTTHLTDESNERFYAPVFPKTHFIKVAQGPFPREFWSLHDSFARENEEAMNASPAAYPPNQVYVIIGCENGGQALDAFHVANYNQAKSIFQQVAMGFAVAERSLEFEHRDAHIGNILISLTADDDIHFRYDKQVYRVPSHGVHVKIIDFTLSRLRNGSKLVYKDLRAEKTIFEGHGDYQFDVYRQMKEATANDWQIFRPQTNVHWLQYLHHIFIETNEKKLKATVKDRHAKKLLTDFQEVFGKYKSTTDLIGQEKMFQSCKA